MSQPPSASSHQANQSITAIVNGSQWSFIGEYDVKVWI